MQEPPGPRHDAAKPTRPASDPASRRHVLVRYLWEYRDRYTDEALSMAADEAGFSPEEIAEAADEVARRRRDEIAARPVKARARRAVIAIYGVTFIVFAVLFLRPLATQGNTFQTEIRPYALGVLGLVMLVALAIGLAFVRAQRPSADRAEGAFGLMLAVPVVLLVIVAGLCVVTTGPLLTAPGA